MKALSLFLIFVAETYGPKLLPYLLLYFRNLFVTGLLKIIGGYASYRTLQFFEVWETIPRWVTILGLVIGIAWMFISALPPVYRWLIKTTLRSFPRNKASHLEL